MFFDINMFEFTKLMIVCGFLNVVTCHFVHEPSAIEIKPNGVPNIDFGFSMAFQNGANPNLVVSAPTDTYIGRVYGCNLKDFPNVNCNAANIDVENLAPSNRSAVNADQKFYLGASIAATPDYFVTCAPLWIGLVKRRPNDPSAKPNHGTCFVYSNNGTAFNIEYLRNNIDYYKGGGIGWNTLVDDTKIMIAKPAYTGNFLYMAKTNPFKSLLTKGYMSDNTGYGLAVGNFFNKDKMYYAFSARETDMSGKIHFLMANTLNRQLFHLTSQKIGSMFGYSMSAADINEDGVSDLIVGAPLFREEYDLPEFGAIHIYVGGDKIRDKSNLRTIVATVEGGRFGMAITTADMDGDKIPEIIVSAPYENSAKGAVYILSGHELKEILIEPQNKHIPLSDLKKTQRLQKEEYNHFGYSLQVVKDVDANGFNELAIGVPGNGSVMIYRGLHVVKASISLELNGTDNLQIKGDPTNFTVTVCIRMEYKAKNVSGTISVNCAVSGGNVEIPDSSFEIDLSKGDIDNCKDIIGNFIGRPVGEYNFTTEINIIDEEEKLKNKDFDKSTAVLSPGEKHQSMTFSVFCGDDSECLPKLSLMEPQWSNGPEYTVGTSENETMIIKVRNEGYTVATSCLLVEVEGAGISQLSACDVVGNGKYQCQLFTVRKNVDKTVNLTLDMRDITNANEGLDVKFTLYEVCDTKKEVEKKHFAAKYLLDTGAVSVTGENHPVDITDTDMEKTTDNFRVNQEYSIINSGNMRWVNLNAVIEIEKTPFSINAAISITEKNDCHQTNIAEKIIINCTLSLEKKSTTKVMVGVDVPKDDWAKFLADGNKQTKIESKLMLDLGANNATASARSESIVAYKDERTLANNYVLITIIVIIVALLLLLLISFVLYRRGFFKTESKQKLLEAKETVRRKSIKKSNTSGNSQSQHSEEGEDKDDKEVDIQDNVFEEPTSSAHRDDHKLIEENAQVHC